MDSFKVKGNHCPTCKALLDGASGPTGHPPVAGDISVCVYCAAICSWNEKMELEEMPRAMFEALPLEMQTELHKALAVLSRLGTSFALSKTKKGEVN